MNHSPGVEHKARQRGGGRREGRVWWWSLRCQQTVKMNPHDVTRNDFSDSKKIKIVENSMNLLILLPRLFIFTACWFSLVDFDGWKLRFYLLAMLFVIN